MEMPITSDRMNGRFMARLNVFSRE